MTDEEIKKTLLDHEKRIKALEESLYGKNNTKEIIGVRIDYELMISCLKINRESVDLIYDYNNQQLTLLIVKGQNDKEKIQNITLLIILGYEYLLGEKQIDTQKIRRNVSEHGLSLSNFAKYIKELMPTFISRIGKPKSHNIQYRLTTPGKKKAEELIMSLLNN